MITCLLIPTTPVVVIGSCHSPLEIGRAMQIIEDILVPISGVRGERVALCGEGRRFQGQVLLHGFRIEDQFHRLGTRCIICTMILVGIITSWRK